MHLSMSGLIFIFFGLLDDGTQTERRHTIGGQGLQSTGSACRVTSFGHCHGKISARYTKLGFYR
jgi:hypothetical protein